MSSSNSYACIFDSITHRLGVHFLIILNNFLLCLLNNKKFPSSYTSANFCYPANAKNIKNKKLNFIQHCGTSLNFFSRFKNESIEICLLFAWRNKILPTPSANTYSYFPKVSTENLSPPSVQSFHLCFCDFCAGEEPQFTHSRRSQVRASETWLLQLCHFCVRLRSAHDVHMYQKVN